MKIFHFRSGYVAATLAAEKRNDETFAFSLALCSPKDQFCKKIGRNIATGRLRKNPKIATDFNHLRAAIKHEINTNWVPRGYVVHAQILCNEVDERMNRTKAFQNKG